MPWELQTVQVLWSYKDNLICFSFFCALLLGHFLGRRWVTPHDFFPLPCFGHHVHSGKSIATTQDDVLPLSKVSLQHWAPLPGVILLSKLLLSKGASFRLFPFCSAVCLCMLGGWEQLSISDLFVPCSILWLIAPSLRYIILLSKPSICPGDKLFFF